MTETEKAIAYYEKRIAIEKEQIKEYEGLGGEFAVSAPLRESVLERHEHVLNALREQLEREKGCEMCKGRDSLLLRKAHKYCKYCGRRLKEEKEDGSD